MNETVPESDLSTFDHDVDEEDDRIIKKEDEEEEDSSLPLPPPLDDALKAPLTPPPAPAVAPTETPTESSSFGPNPPDPLIPSPISRQIPDSTPLATGSVEADNDVSRVQAETEAVVQVLEESAASTASQVIDSVTDVAVNQLQTAAEVVVDPTHPDGSVEHGLPMTVPELHVDVPVPPLPPGTETTGVVPTDNDIVVGYLSHVHQSHGTCIYYSLIL